jgi:hypothetical protein
MSIEARLKACVPAHCWDDERDLQFCWEYPGSDFRVDVDEDGDVFLYRGRTWTAKGTHFVTADEARWLRDVWPAVLQYVEAVQS